MSALNSWRQSSRRQGERCLSDRTLDRLKLGELTIGDLAPVRNHLDACRFCAARLRTLEEADAEPLLPLRPIALPAVPVARRRWPAAVALALAAAAVILIVPTVALEGLRLKGGDALDLVVRRGPRAAVERVLPGGTLHPGDAIRFELSVRTPSHVVILGLDAEGQVTPYFPQAPSAEPIPEGRGILLPGSIVLDDTLGPERLFALFCNDPLSVDHAVEAGRQALAAHAGHPEQLESLPLPCRQTTFLFEKSVAR